MSFLHGEILRLAVEEVFYCGQEKRLMWPCLFSFFLKGCMSECESEEGGLGWGAREREESEKQDF